MEKINNETKNKKFIFRRFKNKTKFDKNDYFKKGEISKNSPILNVQNVSKEFNGFKALKNISFKIQKGERVGLIGGNGAGKTTLTEIIAGIDVPTSGFIEYGFEFDKSHKENIGMQFQQSDYPSGLTVKDIVLFAKNLRKLNFKNNEIKEFLRIFQMEDFYNRKVKSLSGGQKQKLNILLSLIHNPELVILDELSTGLDISAREEIISFTDNLLKEKGISLILISHHMEEIKELCSKIIILNNGTIDEIKEIEEIEKEHNTLDNYCKEKIKTFNLNNLENPFIKKKRFSFKIKRKRDK